MSLVEHARRELELSGQYEEDPEYSESLIKAIEAFSAYGHSGGSHFAALGQLTRLLEYKNLSPLTDNPDEWMEVGNEFGLEPMWQNKRNSEAFSEDGGKSYYLLSERVYRSWRNFWLKVTPIHYSAAWIDV